MKKLPYILLIGGGSGGHVLPIIMLAERFGDRVLWIGEWRNSFDQKKARDHSIAFYGVPSVKIRKYAPWTFLTQPLYGLIAFFMTCIYLLRNRPKVIFSKGGWVALAPAIAGILLGIPLVLHESDTRSGSTQKFLGRFAERVLLGFAEWTADFPNHKKKEVIGHYLHPLYIKAASCVFSLPKKRKQHIVVQCGGLGSTKIFETLLQSLPDLRDHTFDIALGALNEHFLSRFEVFSNVQVKKWMNQEDLVQAYMKADIAIMRSSANSLAEATLFGCRIITIPLEIASRDHQNINALSWENTYPDTTILKETQLGDLTRVLQSLWDFRKDRFSPHTGALQRTVEILENYSSSRSESR